MRYPAVLPFQEILPALSEFDAIIDVRSPGEFAEDHIPGAINCPVLDDAQRVEIGTMYKQVDSFEARKLGAAYVTRNIALHIEQQFLHKPHGWKPLIYCWRGGNRSGATAYIFSKIGWPVVQLDGGYKAYRTHVNTSLSTMSQGLRFQVVCGSTGTGKSRLLRTLAAQGAQVLDLEQLARHRGSVLGNLPGIAQPSQKRFESQIWEQLRHANPSLPIFVEAESKKIGNLRVPDALMSSMRAAPCVNLTMPLANRVDLLIDEYSHFVSDPALFNSQLVFLIPLHGKEKIARWQQQAMNGSIAATFEDLLTQHYDPAYRQSSQRNFSQYANAIELALPDNAADSFERAARFLIDSFARDTPFSSIA
jgi:tRNA 2-selenouridine synthase